MSKKPCAPGHRRCKCCNVEKPEAQFLKISKPGWRVVYCDACARKNMARYWRVRAIVTDFNKIARSLRE